MTSAWDHAGTLPVPPPDDLDDGDVILTDQGTYWECDATDWHLMLAWFAGPDTLMRYPDTREQWWTVVETEPGGDRQISRRPVSDEDRRRDEDDLNEQLAQRGIPPRPSGFRWFQLVPPGGTGRDVLAAYFRVQSEMPERYDMDRETAYARAAVEELYGLPVTPPPPIPPEAWDPVPEDPVFSERRRAENAQVAELMTGPPGVVPILSCRDLARAIAFYETLGFQGQELSGYAVLRSDDAELHLSRHSGGTPSGCLIRVPDAAGLWQSLQDRPTLGPLEDDNPGMVSFRLLDPDGNHLIFVSGR